MKYLFFLIFLVSLNIYSQSNNNLSNAEFEDLKLKVKLQIRNNLDSAFYYCDKIEVSKNNLHKVFAKSYKAYIFQLKNDTISSNNYLEFAKTLLKKEKTSFQKNKIETQLLNLSGLIDIKRAKYSDAITNFETGIIIAKKDNDVKQLIKFNNNISLIYIDINNIKKAIPPIRYNDSIIEEYKNLYSFNEFLSTKSLMTFNLGRNYLEYYFKSNKKIHLDSSEYYFNKNLNYSKDVLNDKIYTQINLANIKILNNDFKNAEKFLNSSYILSKDNGLIQEISLIKRNLGILYYKQKEYNKSLISFKEVDSIYALNQINLSDFIYSNYHQSKIFELLKDNKKAVYHSDVFEKEYYKNQSNISDETINVYNVIGLLDMKKEIIKLKSKANFNLTLNLILKGFFFSLFIFLVFFLIKFKKEKKNANIKLEKLLSEFNNNNNTAELKKKSLQNLAIDDEKELGILNSLNKLEQKKYYLSKDFSQQNIAKKIKTNTTYLSYVVNKNYNKSFSEYSNELKINYAIDQLINNPTYRKYSTQAIAESVGFKNAISFTKSFKKRAGVSPAQFILRINKSLIF